MYVVILSLHLFSMILEYKITIVTSGPRYQARDIQFYLFPSEVYTLSLFVAPESSGARLRPSALSSVPCGPWCTGLFKYPLFTAPPVSIFL